MCLLEKESRDTYADEGSLYCLHTLYLCYKEHQITCKCLCVFVGVCALGSETRCNVRNNEASRQACIKYTHMDARTHKLNKTSSLSAIFIFTSVINNHQDINNPSGINSTNHTHAHTHAHTCAHSQYKHIYVPSQ